MADPNDPDTPIPAWLAASGFDSSRMGVPLDPTELSAYKASGWARIRLAGEFDLRKLTKTELEGFPPLARTILERRYPYACAVAWWVVDVERWPDWRGPVGWLAVDLLGEGLGAWFEAGRVDKANFLWQAKTGKRGRIAEVKPKDALYEAWKVYAEEARMLRENVVKELEQKVRDAQNLYYDACRELKEKREELKTLQFVEWRARQSRGDSLDCTAPQDAQRLDT